jgi:hypothetical protein
MVFVMPPLTIRDSLAAGAVRTFSQAFPAFSLVPRRHYTENATTSPISSSNAIAACILLYICLL